MMNSNGQITQLGQQYIGEITVDQDNGGQTPTGTSSASDILNNGAGFWLLTGLHVVVFVAVACLLH